MFNHSKIGLYLILAVAIILGIYFNFARKNSVPNLEAVTQTNVSAKPETPAAHAPKKILVEPISNALSRITKKPFGIRISPQNSPVSPEKFSGFHTGVDFETLPDEQNIDVPIFAICDGPLLLKKWSSGYGGVAVQKCNIEGEDVTVIYGHLKLASIAIASGEQIKAGRQIAILGQAFSMETDGERKHLHLGIHKGAAINILGYVQNQTELSLWLDAAKYF